MATKITWTKDGDLRVDVVYEHSTIFVGYEPDEASKQSAVAKAIKEIARDAVWDRDHAR